MHPKAAALIAFCDSEFDPERRRRIASHLEACAKCREQLRRIEGEKLDLVAVAAGPPPAKDAREGLDGVLAAIGAWQRDAASAASPQLRRLVRERLEVYFGSAAAPLVERPDVGPDEVLSKTFALVNTFLGPEAADAVMNDILEASR